MIPSVGETARGVIGALRLARFDASGAEAFKDDHGAAYRSFWVAVIAFPIYLIIQATIGVGGADLKWLIVMGCAYVISWGAILVAIAELAEASGKGDRIFKYVSAHNWAQLVGLIIALMAMSIDLATSPDGRGPLIDILSIYLLIYHGFIIRAVLDFSIFGAIGVVMLSIFIDVIVNISAAGVLQ